MSWCCALVFVVCCKHCPTVSENTLSTFFLSDQPCSVPFGFLAMPSHPVAVHQEGTLAEAANAQGDAATAPKAPPKPQRQVGSGQAHAIARDYTRDLGFCNYT